MFNSSHRTAKDKREIWVSGSVCVYVWCAGVTLCLCVVLFVVARRHLLNNESPVRSACVSQRDDRNRCQRELRFMVSAAQIHSCLRGHMLV